MGEERVKILDFGLVKATLESSTPMVRTENGTFMGTVQYMSPEQTLDEPVDARADQYSVAVLLYRMLTGRLPFQADNPVEIVQAHRYHPVPAMDPSLGIPAGLEQAVRRALSKSPEARWPDADSFAAVLRDSIGLDPHPMRTPEPIYMLTRRKGAIAVPESLAAGQVTTTPARGIAATTLRARDAIEGVLPTLPPTLVAAIGVAIGASFVLAAVGLWRLVF